MESKFDNGVGYSIIVIAGKLKNKFYQLLSAYNITPEQWIILTRLRDKDGKTQKQLALETFKDEANIARILRKMEDKGYLERRSNDKDKRISLVYITQEGVQLFDQLIPLVNKHQEGTVKKLSKDEISTLINLLEKLEYN